MHILLYVPNIIGYVRAIFMVMSWNEALSNPSKFLWYYSISYVLDMADGLAARSLNQCSKFGAVLDMVLDRVATASLFAILASTYPEYCTFFYIFLGLDLGSHWLQVVTTYMAGNVTHKGVDKDETFIVRMYYQSKVVLATICACAEFFGCALYCSAHKELDWLYYHPVIQVLFYISIVGFAIKQFINLVQIKTSTFRLVEADHTPEERKIN